MIERAEIRFPKAHEGASEHLGVASYDQSMTKNEQLINKADEALYRAKTNGKNRVEY